MPVVDAGILMSPSDQTLLERIAQGDAPAFSAFYDRHSARVFGLLNRMLQSASDAEDVLQEVFWQVWTHAGRYDFQRASPAAWLIVLARSRALDFLRKRKNLPLATEDLERGALDDPSLKLEQDERARRVLGALKSLPADQRKAVELSFFGGLTHEEIAERLSLPLGTAKSRIRLGMGRLRQALHAIGEEPLE